MYIDNTYDMVVVPLYKWVPCDPDLDKVRKEYMEENLNNLVDNTDKQNQEALAFHQVRKKYDITESKGTTDKASDVLDNNTTDIWIRGKEQAEVQKFTMNLDESEAESDSNSDSEVEEKLFKKADDDIRELEEKIRHLMITEGIGESEARNRFRIKFDKREPKKVYEEEKEISNLPPKDPPRKTVDLESLSEKVERLKREGKTTAEIREIMNNNE